MTIVLIDDQREIIERGLAMGLYSSPQAVVNAALKSLSEDWQELALIKERSAEARFSLTSLEAEVRGEGQIA